MRTNPFRPAVEGTGLRIWDQAAKEGISLQDPDPLINKLFLYIKAFQIYTRTPFFFVQISTTYQPAYRSDPVQQPL